MIQDPVALLAFLLSVVVFSRWLEGRFRFVREISSAVVCTLLGIALANVGVIPFSSPVHSLIMEFAVPYAIVLVILSSNLADLKVAGRPLMIGFGLAGIGSLLGGLLSGIAFRPWVGPETGKVAGQFVAAFVGGGVNFVAVGRGLETSPSLFAAANVADNLSTVPWMLAQIGLFTLLAPYYKSGVQQLPGAAALAPGQEQAALQTSNGPVSTVVGGSLAGDLKDDPRRFWTHTSTDVGELALLAALPLAVVWLSRRLSPLLPGFPEVLWLTTIALVLAQIPWFRPVRRSSAVCSYFCLHLFFISLGAASIISDVLKAGPSLFIFMTCIIAIHALIVYGVGWMLGVDLRSLTIASQATVGGPGSALALSLSMQWKELATPGIIIGIFGYGIGNYFGFGCAYLLRGYM